MSLYSIMHYVIGLEKRGDLEKNVVFEVCISLVKTDILSLAKLWMCEMYSTHT